MGKGRPWAALTDHMVRFVPRAPIWVSQELTCLITSLQAEKLLPYQAGVLEVCAWRKKGLLNRYHCAFMQRERRKEKEKQGSLECGKVCLCRAAALCWTSLKEKGWQHLLPIAAGVDTVSHLGHCWVCWSWHGLLSVTIKQQKRSQGYLLVCFHFVFCTELKSTNSAHVIVPDSS